MTDRDTSTSPLSAAQVAEFHERGTVHIRGAFPRSVANDIEAMLWEEVERRTGVHRGEGAPWGTMTGPGFARFGRHPLFAQIATPRLTAAFDALLGAGTWRYPKRWGGILADPPGGEPSDTPPTGWHFDGQLGSGGAMFFSVFAALEPRQGGTVLLQGSHRLIAEFAQSVPPEQRKLPNHHLRHRLRRWDATMRELTGQVPPDRSLPSFYDGRPWRDTVLRVVDVWGEPGDVWACKGGDFIHAGPAHVARPRFLSVRGVTAN